MEIDERPRMIILTPDDEVKSDVFEKGEDLFEAVNGFTARLCSVNLPCGINEIVNCDVYCNDCFLIDESKEFDKLNAVASALFKQEVRGNVVILPREGLDNNRGFEYIENEEGEEDFCECWFAEDRLMLFVNQNREALKELHNEFDIRDSFVKDSEARYCEAEYGEAR